MKAKKIEWRETMSWIPGKKFPKKKDNKPNELYGYVGNHFMFVIDFNDKGKVVGLRHFLDGSVIFHKPKDLTRAKAMSRTLLRRKVARLSKYLTDISE